MDTFIENLADFFKSLFKVGGFWGGSVMYLAIGVLLAFMIIKNRYETPFICNSLGEQYSALKEKHDDDAIATMFVKNGVMILGIVYVNLIKVLTGLVYAFILKTETLSFLDLSFTSFPIKEFGYTIIATPNSNRTTLIFFALLYAWIQSIVNKSIAQKSLIDTKQLDFFASAAVFVICFIAPSGFCFYVLAFTIVECLITILNLGPLKERNEKKIESKITNYKKAFEKKLNKK